MVNKKKIPFFEKLLPDKRSIDIARALDLPAITVYQWFTAVSPMPVWAVVCISQLFGLDGKEVFNALCEEYDADKMKEVRRRYSKLEPHLKAGVRGVRVKSGQV